MEGPIGLLHQIHPGRVLVIVLISGTLYGCALDGRRAVGFKNKHRGFQSGEYDGGSRREICVQLEAIREHP